jgi:hypothetical protein
VLPKSYYLDKVNLRDTIPSDSGRFADVREARLDGRQVYIKIFRTQTGANQVKIKQVCVKPLRQDCEDRLIAISVFIARL